MLSTNSATKGHYMLVINGFMKQRAAKGISLTPGDGRGGGRVQLITRLYHIIADAPQDGLIIIYGVLRY